jgi:NTP pyrophosphatase (non-canonical NTP hydrolase)
MLLHGEVAESFQAWRRAQPDLGEELADVALYLFELAQMNGVTLASCRTKTAQPE